MPTVELVHWNPRVPAFSAPILRRLPIGKRVSNFGDLLGPAIVRKVLAANGIDARMARKGARLLSVGSILRLAHDGDTVWGSGANGKSLNGDFHFKQLDVRAVRGPLTMEFLEQRGVAVPRVFGDPGLLVGHLWSREELRAGFPEREVTIIPNLNDVPAYDMTDARVIDPRSSLDACLGAIASSRLVIGSSLHAIVIAESLGIPARLIASGSEPEFKYLDYYRGSGRAGYRPAASIDEAIKLGGEPVVRWDAERLLEAFPLDLWAA